MKFIRNRRRQTSGYTDQGRNGVLDNVTIRPNPVYEKSEYADIRIDRNQDKRLNYKKYGKS